MKTRFLLVALCLLVALLASPMLLARAAAGAPLEAGQSAFAALQEIIAVLEADPATDWSRVDISGLRDHLVDMDRLVLHTTVDQQPIPGGLVMTVSGDTSAQDAARRMVAAHAPTLDAIAGWRAEATATENGIRLTVTAEAAAATLRIRGLGFFGLMASGAHHQPHHLALARGMAMH